MQRLSSLKFFAFTATALFFALSTPNEAVGQFLTSPQPGDIYKDFARVNSGNILWRVTDPNATHPDAADYLPNPELTLNIDDLQDAIRAELIIDHWGGHIGTTGKRFRFNGNAWLDLPEIDSAPVPEECYINYPNPVIQVPLNHLVEGGNILEGTSGGQTCGNFHWGHWGWYSVILRVYYSSSKSHATGSITSPGSGDAFGDGPNIEVSTSGGVNRVEVVAFHNNYDTDGDGRYIEYHHDYHRGKNEGQIDIGGHVGTDSSSPFQFTWDTSLVPDQAPGSIKLVALLRNSSGVWFVTDEVTNLTLQRSSTSIRIYKPSGVPEDHFVRNGEVKSSQVLIPPEDFNNASSAFLLVKTWNGRDGGGLPGEEHSTKVNSWTTPDFGQDHFYSYDAVSVPVNQLITGLNTITFESQTTLAHGIEIPWPGPAILVKYTNTAPMTPSVLPAMYGFEGGGNVIDDVMNNGNDGILEDGAVRTNSGKFGKAVEIDGQSGHVNLGLMDLYLGAFTISMWVRPSAFTVSDARLISKAYSLDEHHHVFMVGTFNNNQIRFRLRTIDAGVDTLVAGVLQVGTWTHVACVYDGAQMRIYRDGSLVGSKAVTGTVVSDGSIPVWIGDHPGGGGKAFDGRIDDVRILPFAQTPGQILVDMANPAGTSPQDEEPPSAPENVIATPISTSQIALEWDPSTDDVGVAGYKVLRDGLQVATTSSVVTEYFDTGLTINTTYGYRIVAFDAGANEATSNLVEATTLATDPPPLIDIWYGDIQDFGTIGIPQPWINVLGNVSSSSSSVVDLFYQLNGGSPVALSMGPDSFRLGDFGDFNVDLHIEDVNPGTNTVEITAEDAVGRQSTRTVTVNFDDSNTWPEIYTIDWDPATDIQDVSQVIDGEWRIEGDPIGGFFLRPLQLKYDRLVAVGDMLWTDYEVTVPITIFDFDPGGFLPPSNRPAVGMIMRWPGHSETGDQPERGVRPIGGAGLYRIWEDGSNRLQIWHNNGISNGPLRTLDFGVPYIFKMRVETIEGVGGLYSFKVWDQSQTEPAGWDMQRQEGLSDPQEGCLVLLGHHVDAFFGTVTVNTLDPECLLILEEPQNTVACEGGDVTLSVLAIGAPTLTYQWFKNGALMPGETNRQLTIVNASVADVGDYHVNVTNSCGSVSSAVATLTVDQPPQILTHPTTQTVCEGESVFLSVSAIGPGLSYQWLKDGIPLTGATAADLIIDPVTDLDAGDYTVDVTSTCATLTSDPAQLLVDPAPDFLIQPAATDVCLGDAATLTVSATGLGLLSYQWRVDGIDIAGATSDSYTVTDAQLTDQGLYDVVVTSDVCGTTTSDAADLRVESEPTILTDPAPTVACEGDTVSLTVLVNAFEPITYQWRKDGVDIPDGTTATLTLTELQGPDSGDYDVVINDLCGTVTSSAATLAVGPGVEILSQPTNQTVCEGLPATFSVGVGGEGVTVQWRKDGVQIPGGTDPILTIDAVGPSDAGVYDAELSNGCEFLFTDAATLTLDPPFVVTAPPQSQVACQGESMTLSVDVVGAEPVTYQWRKDGQPIPGVTDASFTIGVVGVEHAGTYDVEVANVCGVITSDPAIIGVITEPTISSLSPDTPICFGGTATLSVEASGSPSFEFQWQKDGFDILGATAASYTIAGAAVTDDGGYSVVVSNLCGSTTSEVVNVAVQAEPEILTQPGSQSVCSGTAATFQVAVSGVEPVTYQWQKDGVNIPGATSASYTVHPVTAADAGLIGVVVSDACGGFTTSDPATLSVSTLEITSQPLDQSVCQGGPVTFSAQAVGKNQLEYQWRKNNVDIPGANDDSFTILEAEPADAGNYDVVVSDVCSAVTSSTAVLSFAEFPAILEQPSGRTFCPGASLEVHAVVAGADSAQFQWRKGGQPIPGATSPTLSIATAAATDAGIYDLLVSNACGSVSTSPITLTMVEGEELEISSQPQSQQFCENDQVTMEITVTDGSASGTPPTDDGSIAYQWRLDGIPILGARGADYTIEHATQADAGAYDVIVWNACGSVTSDVATLEFSVDDCLVGFQIGFDCNQDGLSDISDTICLLGFLFLGTVPKLPCGNGMATDPANIGLLDWNDDTRIDISDATSNLIFLFVGGAAHPTFVNDTPTCTPIAGCPDNCQ